MPRVVGKIRRRHPIEVRDLQFLRARTDRMVKITAPGPFTLSQQAQNEHYTTEEEMALDYAAAVNLEIKDLFAAGADMVQIDEPYMEAYPEKARQYGIAALERALEGVTGTTALHICFGYAALVSGRPPAYSFLPELAESSVQQISIETAQSDLDCSVLAKLTGRVTDVEPGNAHVGTAALGCPAERSSAVPPKTIILGVLDLSTHQVETPDAVAARIRRALPFVPAERLIIAPDCGMKYLPLPSPSLTCKLWWKEPSGCETSCRCRITPGNQSDHGQI